MPFEESPLRPFTDQVKAFTTVSVVPSMTAIAWFSRTKILFVLGLIARS